MPWAVLSNYGLVLSYIAIHPHSTAREIADTVGITERTTRKIIADLDAEGYLRKMKEGRRNYYIINADLSLRHPAHGETAVGQFLKVFGWRKRRSGKSPSRVKGPTFSQEGQASKEG